MASKAIRGITVEIGGDTTKLGKAIEDSEKHSRSLQVELREVEKLLKFDPSNVELLAQKQTILTDNISETSKKLDILKESERQVIAQFERGEVAEDQVRALQREIIKTESSLGDMKTELNSTEKAMKELADGTDKAKKNTKEYEEAVEKAKSELNDFKDKASETFDTLKNGAGVLTGLATATGGYALKVSTEFDKAFNTLSTKTGASAEEMKNLEESMERVYANNFGESIEDVANSMAIVKTTTNLTGKELESVTQYALLMRDTFGFEVNESVRAVNSLMDQFGISAEEAYSLIAQGAQKGLNQNDDLLDTINEYSVQFEHAGYTAEDMFNMLANGVESGTWSVDKLGDAVKEFNIRMSDGSAKDAVESLGLSWDEVSANWSKGGDSAKQVFSMLMGEVATLGNTTEGYNAGVGLMGTMYEDLGYDAVLALSNVQGEITKSTDALQKINETKYDDIGSALQGLGRTLETDVIQPLGEELTPYIEDAIEYVKTNGPEIKEFLANVVTKIGEFVGFIVDNGPVILSVITGVGTAFLTWKVATMISGLIGVITSFVGVLKTGTTVMGALNAVMNMNPIFLIITLIAGLVTAFITLWNTSEGFRNFFKGLWEGIKNVVSSVVGAIGNLFSGLWNGIKNIFSGIGNWFKDKFNDAKEKSQQAWANAKEVFSKVKDKVTGAFQNIGEWFKNKFQESKEKSQQAWANAKQVFTKVKDKVTGAFSNIGTWFKNKFQDAKDKSSQAWSNAKQVFTKVKNKVTDAFSDLGPKLKTKFSSALEKAKSGFSKAKSIGSDIVKGLWNGISNMASWIKEKISGFGEKVLGALKSFFGIKSPSRLMRDQVGKYIAEGIGVGITQNADTPLDALKDLGDEMANTDFDVNTATINRKLATTFSVNPEGSVSTGESLLNKLDSIYERLDRLQIVLDTGTLVGETIDKIDAGLASNQLLRARGV